MLNKNRFHLAVTAFVLFASVVSCTGGSSGEKSQEPGNPLTAPTLNETKEVKLQRRSFEVDNYEATCLYLNDSFKNLNICTIALQTDLSVTGVQVTDQKAEFTRTLSDEDLNAAEAPKVDEEPLDRIDGKDLKVGQVWLLNKSDRFAKWSVVFEIVKIEDTQITFKYSVRSFEPAP